jgi:DNA-binding NtrC family response regulator
VESHNNILVLDLNATPCPADTCRELTKLVQGFAPLGQISLQTSDIFPPRLISAVPDLVLLRPSLKESLEELTKSVRRQWNQSSILALFCAGWDNPTQMCQSLLNYMDDFLSCPFKEMDLFLRIQRLFHWKTAPFSPSRSKAIKEKLRLESLVGESESFLQVIEKIPRLANSCGTVLISGETGTGKELFARAIHYNGPRQGKPFIPVNCGALPDHLFENELFGHAKGAFTDASCAEKGLIAEAEGGTLVLDEVDSLSPSAQVKLLRFLQSGEYRPLGSSRILSADTRIIAATNADLKRQLELKLFRPDLYYRLNVLSLSIPPLRERIEDVPYLASHFLIRYAIQSGREPSRLSPGALQKLMVYSWPGNVRELECVIQGAMILSSSPVLQPEEIDLPLPHTKWESEVSSLREAKIRAIEQFERGYLSSLLAAHRGNVTQAAKAAGKQRRTFQRLLRKYSLDRHVFRI